MPIPRPATDFSIPRAHLNRPPLLSPFSPVSVSRNPRPPPTFPVPPSAPGQTTPLKVLPSVSHIPLLGSKRDFNSWIQSVDQTITSLGLYDHICDLDYGVGLDERDPASLPLDPSFRSDIRPSQPPAALTALSSAEDRVAYAKWWEDDNRAQWVLTAKLGAHARSYLPPGPATHQTARSIYQRLRRGMGLDNFTQAGALFHKLTTLACHPSRVLDYVSTWREYVVQLVSARFLLQARYLIFCFLAQLPPSLDSVTTIYSSSLERVDDSDIGAVYELLDMVESAETMHNSLNRMRLGP